MFCLLWEYKACLISEQQLVIYHINIMKEKTIILVDAENAIHD